MKIQLKIMAILMLSTSFAIIACSGGKDTTPTTLTTPTYTVTYDGNTNTGGTVPIDTNTYSQTFTVTVLGSGTLTKTGYTFTCWNTQADGNGTDRAPASTFAMGTANVILYAKWTALPTYTVTYNANTGTGGVPTDSNNYLAGATVTVLGSGTLTKTGYTFTCWNTQADGNGTDLAPSSTFAMSTANVTLYAKWTTLPTYTVTYNANTGTGGVPTDSNNYLAGATVTVLGNGTLTKAGSTFTCWNTQADGNGTDRAPASTFAMGTANVILYAKWTALPTYTVTYNANTGTGGVPTDSNNYLAGATVTVLGSGTLTKTGYTFTCWNTQADGNGTDLAPSSTFAMGTANVTLYAKWTAGYFIGDIGPSGVGIVFYLTDGGLHGLEAAPPLWNGGSADPTSVWISGGTTQTTVNGNTLTAIGTGLANSNAIEVQSNYAASAAMLCRDYSGGGMTDWFLPSQDELAQLYAQKAAVGGFADGIYWSSSEYSATFAWIQSFEASGGQGWSGKSNLLYVRAIRAF